VANCLGQPLVTTLPVVPKSLTTAKSKPLALQLRLTPSKAIVADRKVTPTKTLSLVSTATHRPLSLPVPPNCLAHFKVPATPALPGEYFATNASPTPLLA